MRIILWILLLLFQLIMFTAFGAKTEVREIKEENVIQLTTQNFWFANSLVNAPNIVGYIKTETENGTTYELYFKNDVASINLINQKAKMFNETPVKAEL